MGKDYKVTPNRIKRYSGKPLVQERRTTVTNKLPSPEYYKQFLLNIYKCKVPFELKFRNTKPKSYYGIYYQGICKINLYPKWHTAIPLKEVAIHEYAHHVHVTELSKGDPKLDRTHGHNFMRVYTALRAKADKLGLLDDVHNETDGLIKDILNG